MAFVRSLSLLLVTPALAGSRNKQRQKAGPNLYAAPTGSSAQVEKLDAACN